PIPIDAAGIEPVSESPGLEEPYSASMRRKKRGSNGGLLLGLVGAGAALIVILFALGIGSNKSGPSESATDSEAAAPDKPATAVAETVTETPAHDPIAEIKKPPVAVKH